MRSLSSGGRMDNPEDRELDNILESQLFKCSICGEVEEMRDNAFDKVCFRCAYKVFDGDRREGEE